MRPIAIVLSGVLLSACVVYEPYREPTSASRPRPRVLTRGEAIRAAFALCDERGLEVDRVHHAALDPEGRWRVELRGPSGDRAKLLLDAESGRLLRGRFRDGPVAADAPPPPPGGEAEDD